MTARERAQRIPINVRQRARNMLVETGCIGCLDEIERAMEAAISEAVLAFASQLFEGGPYRSTVIAAGREFLRERATNTAVVVPETRESVKEG